MDNIEGALVRDTDPEDVFQTDDVITAYHGLCLDPLKICNVQLMAQLWNT